jgi:hypothetical protein
MSLYESMKNTASDAITGYVNYYEHERSSDQYSRAAGHDRDQTNAFAHAYVSAMITVERGYFVARLVGDYREVPTTINYYVLGGADDRMDTYRYLYNNWMGRAIGLYAAESGLNSAAVADLVVRSMERGGLDHQDRRPGQGPALAACRQHFRHARRRPGVFRIAWRFLQQPPPEPLGSLCGSGG